MVDPRSSQVIADEIPNGKVWNSAREVHKYSNGLLVFNEVKSPSTKEPITAIIKKNAVAKKVAEEIKVYTEDDHLKSVDDKVWVKIWRLDPRNNMLHSA